MGSGSVYTVIKGIVIWNLLAKAQSNGAENLILIEEVGEVIYFVNGGQVSSACVRRAQAGIKV